MNIFIVYISNPMSSSAPEKGQVRRKRWSALRVDKCTESGQMGREWGSGSEIT